MTATSAINPLRTAVVTALRALTIIGGPASPKVYLGAAPRGTVEPYIILGLSTEDNEASRYQQPGQGQSMQIRCWGTDLWEADEVYSAVVGALHGVTLTVTGYKAVRPQMVRLTDFKERGVPPDEPGPWCVVGELLTETWAA